MTGSHNRPGTIYQILKLVGFMAKAYIIWGQCSGEETKTLGSKFLGIFYNPRADKVLFHRVPFILPNEKRRGTKVGKVTMPYSYQEIKFLWDGTHSLTRRQCLTLMMAQYDPWGLISPENCLAR